MKASTEWAVAALVGIVLATMVRFFIVEGYQISGESMEPTFQSGDYVVAEKVSYKLGDLEYGDIVIVKTDLETEMKIIKRVIGLPGDHVSIRGGVVYRNAEALVEPYIQEAPNQDFDEIIVPEGEIFVLGDNRNHSSDSRDFGTFTYAQVKGRVAFEIYNNPFTFY